MLLPWLDACQVGMATLEALILQGSSVLRVMTALLCNDAKVPAMAQLAWHLAQLGWSARVSRAVFRVLAENLPNVSECLA